jgi:hypothetical protein
MGYQLFKKKKKNESKKAIFPIAVSTLILPFSKVICKEFCFS